MSGGNAELVTIDILGFPIEEHRRAAEHFDELLREFALIRHDAGSAVPDRLFELRSTLSNDFGSFTAGAQSEMDAAVAEGRATIDLCYRVPPGVGAAAQALGDLLDEADEYCRSGAHLLTLATPGRSVRFRRWFLGEFVRQAAGQAPRPWSGPD